MLAGINAGMADGRKKARIQRAVRAVMACAAAVLVLSLGVMYVMEAGWMGERGDIGILSPGEVVPPDLPDSGQPAPMGDASDAFVPSRDFAVWRAQYAPSIVAWIHLDGTDIDFPIVQGVDNDFYLYHTPDGREAPYGSIFMDFRNSPDFSDQNTFIYGHHMITGGRFTTLMQYQYQWFYEMNPTVSIYTPYANYALHIFAVYILDNNVESPYLHFFSTEYFYKEMDQIIARSLITSAVRPTFDDRIVYLVTCPHTRPQDRLLVVGILVDAETPCYIQDEVNELGEWWNDLDYQEIWGNELFEIFRRYTVLNEELDSQIAIHRQNVGQVVLREHETHERRFELISSGGRLDEPMPPPMRIVDGQVIYFYEPWRHFQLTMREYTWARVISGQDPSGRINTITCGDFLQEDCGGYLFIERNMHGIHGQDTALDGWFFHYPFQSYIAEDGTLYEEMARRFTISIFCSVCDFLQQPFDTGRLSHFYEEYAWFHRMIP